MFLFKFSFREWSSNFKNKVEVSDFGNAMPVQTKPEHVLSSAKGTQMPYKEFFWGNVVFFPQNVNLKL